MKEETPSGRCSPSLWASWTPGAPACNPHPPERRVSSARLTRLYVFLVTQGRIYVLRKLFNKDIYALVFGIDVVKIVQHCFFRESCAN
jgi:hypothetical protein